MTSDQFVVWLRGCIIADTLHIPSAIHMKLKKVETNSEKDYRQREFVFETLTKKKKVG